MVTAVRNPADYDGIIAGDPGFHLPKAAIGEMYGAQQFAIASATGSNAAGYPSGFTDAERSSSAQRSSRNAMRSTARPTDGAGRRRARGTSASMRTFRPANGTRTGACRRPRRDRARERVHGHAQQARRFYAGFPYDPGIAGGGPRGSSRIDHARPGREGVHVHVAAKPPRRSRTPGFALGSMDNDAPAIFATSGVAQSAWTFMTPPDETNLSALKTHGAKLLVYHGTGDPVFSFDDTRDWYARVARTAAMRRISRASIRCRG